MAVLIELGCLVVLEEEQDRQTAAPQREVLETLHQHHLHKETTEGRGKEPRTGAITMLAAAAAQAQ